VVDCRERGGEQFWEFGPSTLQEEKYKCLQGGDNKSYEAPLYVSVSSLSHPSSIPILFKVYSLIITTTKIV
jgi:hypothetical protein